MFAINHQNTPIYVDLRIGSDLTCKSKINSLILSTGVVLGAQLWGYVSDTKGRRLTLVLSMSVGFVFAALSSFAPNWQTMALLKLVSSTL